MKKEKQEQARGIVRKVFRESFQMQKQLDHAVSEVEVPYWKILDLKDMAEEDKAKELATLLVSTELGKRGIFTYQEALEYASNDIEELKKTQNLLAKLREI